MDDILTSQERVACTFNTPIINMGYLDPGTESENIQAGSRLELPCWLARSLCGGNRRRRIVTAELPRQYREVFREILSADASVVDLHKLGPYYFSFGSYMVKYFENTESSDIAKALLKAFQSRLRRIMDGCQYALDAHSSTLMETLDESERRVFENGSRGLAEYLCWETRKTEQLMSSTMVTNFKKRKRAQIDETDAR
jgi:GINS complex subunit 3